MPSCRTVWLIASVTATVGASERFSPDANVAARALAIHLSAEAFAR